MCVCTMVWQCLYRTHVCATWHGSVCVHEHMWEHGTACGRTRGVLCADPKACAYGVWMWEQFRTGLGVRDWDGPGLTKHVCVSIAGGMTHAPGMGTQAICQQWSGPPGQRRATGSQSQEKEELNCHPSPQFPPAGGEGFQGPGGLPIKNTGDSAALALFSLLFPGGGLHMEEGAQSSGAPGRAA